MTHHQQIAEWLHQAHRAVAFTGAGISTESGIPDYRSPQGIWATSQPVYFDEFLASAAARYEYWRQKAVSHRDMAGGVPNVGHRVLAAWEESGRLGGVITQNIDGLHTLAGSHVVYELHGTAREVACLSCSARFAAAGLVAQFVAENKVPLCPACGSELLKHATISFGQPLDDDLLQEAIDVCRRADLILALGSSLVVEPAASLPRIAHAGGARLVIINRDPTPLDRLADCVVHAGIGETLQAIDACLRG